MDNISRLHFGFGNYSLPTHFSLLSEQRVKGLEEHIGLLAMQPVPCPSRCYVGGEGQGLLVYEYT